RGEGEPAWEGASYDGYWASDLYRRAPSRFTDSSASENCEGASRMNSVEKLYARLPVFAQHAAVSAYGAYWHWLRFGRGYARLLKEYKNREAYSWQEWQTFQRENLKQLLERSARSVPYYRDHWSKSDRAAAAAGRIEELPLLQKASLRADPKAFLREDLKVSRLLTFHTSGSTGTPVRTLWTVAELRDSMALREVRSAGWAGVSFRRPRATFSGRL